MLRARANPRVRSNDKECTEGKGNWAVCMFNQREVVPMGVGCLVSAGDGKFCHAPHGRDEARPDRNGQGWGLDPGSSGSEARAFAPSEML